jgi:hypothetical protein
MLWCGKFFYKKEEKNWKFHFLFLFKKWQLSDKILLFQFLLIRSQVCENLSKKYVIASVRQCCVGILSSMEGTLYHNTLGSFDTNYIIFRNVEILIFFSGLKIEFFWSKLIFKFFFENILFLTIIQSSDKNFEELVYWWFLIIFHKLLIDFVWSSLDNFRDIFKYNYLLSKPNYLTSFLIGISYPYN